MNFKQLCSDAIKEAAPSKALRMQELLGQDYHFLGLDAAARRRVFAPYLKEIGEEGEIDWEFIDSCWEQNIREFQYFGLSYLLAVRDKLQKEDLPKLRSLMITRPHWDTANIFQKLLNYLSAKSPEFGSVYLEWAGDMDEPWLQRVVLLHQMGRGVYTDLELQENIMKACQDSEEPCVRSALKKSQTMLRKLEPASGDRGLSSGSERP